MVAGHLGGGGSAPVNNGAALLKQLNLDLGRVSGDGGMRDAGPACKPKQGWWSLQCNTHDSVGCVSKTHSNI